MAARERAERERVAAAAAEAARQALPCESCGLPEAAGLCPACTSRRRTDSLVREAVDLAVAVRADTGNPTAVEEMSRQCERDTLALLAAACERECGPDADPALLAYTKPLVARRIRDERRKSALWRLTRSEPASSEAAAVYTANRRRHHGQPKEAARHAAPEAALRTAETLLGERLDQMEAARRQTAAA